VRIEIHDGFQHIIARRIERRKVFWTKADYTDFLDRLSNILKESGM
jgi:hypothetical protein